MGYLEGCLWLSCNLSINSKCFTNLISDTMELVDHYVISVNSVKPRKVGILLFDDIFIFLPLESFVLNSDNVSKKEYFSSKV